MQPLTLWSPGAKRKLEILCIGAHCDDIEIGCAGALLSLIESSPGCRVHWMVLTSTAARKREALSAMRDLVPQRLRGRVRIGALRDGFLPAQLAMVKREFERMKALVRPDVIFTHQLRDRHQDHALVGEVTWQTFRDHLILEYEVLKYDGDLSQPNLYVPLGTTVADRKCAAIGRHFSSQGSKSWFDRRNFEALMRVRGVECRAASGYAEAFHARKLVLGS